MSLRHLDAFEDKDCAGFAKRPRTFILTREDNGFLVFPVSGV